MTDTRPDPDLLLEMVQREQEKALRGKLKIFFGASAGVGKTYAMLSAAHQLRARGLDVVVGIAETHGRAETVALMDGLEVLPRKEVEYRGKRIAEFDLEGALKRHPPLILIDELAHSNVPGSRHPKRWQDVDELLAAGIDVYTTINVQHLETLNDIVGGITGIRVKETVPDKVFDQADEVTLVDLTPDELLLRLKEGKIYLPQQAEGAIGNFFRKGNLIALRELALRRTADRVDDQMRIYRQERSIGTVWRTQDSILVCVGPKPGAEKIIRSASRIASQFGVEWHAVYVETPQLQYQPNSVRERILKSLEFAQELGARTAALAGQQTERVLIDYARSHNLSKIIVGRDQHRSWHFWKRSFADRLGRLSADMDIIQIANIHPGTGIKTESPTQFENAPRSYWKSYLWTATECATVTGIATLLLPYFDLANIVMLFLLAVVFAAVKHGRRAAILAAFLNVILFDFFFVPPRFSFAVSDVQYLLTFAVMLIVALIIGQMTANLTYQVRVANQRETRLRALYEMARDLSSVLLPQQIVDISHRYIETTFKVKVAILLPDTHDTLQPTEAAAGVVPAIDPGIAQWSFDRAEPAGFSTDTLSASSILYLPLRAPMRTRGVLAIEPLHSGWLLIPEQRRQLDGFVALIATTLERVHYIDVAQEALVRIESERLRNSVLSALSHDLRTPLTNLAGLSESLAHSRPELPPLQYELAIAIRDQTFRMSSLVNNLLDMARLQSGNVKLNLQWESLEEVIGSALASCEQQLKNYRVDVRLPDEFPLLQFDTMLIRSVLINLLENAVKYTPPHSHIIIEAHLESNLARISVTDNGPGIAHGSEESIFEKFTRGVRESATPGVGLGLTICRAIADAHKGRIWAENIASGGARFVFTLPLGIPPTLDTEEKE